MEGWAFFESSAGRSVVGDNIVFIRKTCPLLIKVYCGDQTYYNFIAVRFPYSKSEPRAPHLKIMNSVSIFLDFEISIAMNGHEPRPLATPTHETGDKSGFVFFFIFVCSTLEIFIFNCIPCGSRLFLLFFFLQRAKFVVLHLFSCSLQNPIQLPTRFCATHRHALGTRPNIYILFFA